MDPVVEYEEHVLLGVGLDLKDRELLLKNMIQMRGVRSAARDDTSIL